MIVGQPYSDCRYLKRTPQANPVAEGDPSTDPGFTIELGHPFAQQFWELRQQAKKEDMFYMTEHCRKCGQITAIRISASA
jgi:hypothetical protein